MSAADMSNLLRRLEPARGRLAAHTIYDSLLTIEDVRIFMEHHVFAVWDFMSLLKSLQRSLTCVQLPWIPIGSPQVRRLINEIVLEEETDAVDGKPVSHFELDHRAMTEIGANTLAVDALIDSLRVGTPVDVALSECGAPAGACAFTAKTFEIIGSGKPHMIAAAFTFGREEPIPNMFRTLVRALGRQTNNRLETFITYLDRHIGLDEDHHAPMAVAMLAELCGNSRQRWDEAAQAAIDALSARVALWSTVVTAVSQTRMGVLPWQAALNARRNGAYADRAAR